MELARDGRAAPNRALALIVPGAPTHQELFVFGVQRKEVTAVRPGECAMWDQAVRDALKVPGCAVCLLVAEQQEQFLHWYGTECYNTIEFIDAVDQGPFCHAHACRIVEGMGLDIGAPMSVIIRRERERVAGLRRWLWWLPWPFGPIYRWLVRREAVAPHQAAAVRRTLGRKRLCRACESEAIMADFAVHTLARMLESGEDWERYAESDGLCRDHVAALLACTHPALAARILADLEGRLDRILANLGRMAYKLDDRHAGEPRGDEMHAWRTALEYESGWISPSIRPGAASANRFSTPLRRTTLQRRAGEFAFGAGAAAVPPRDAVPPPGTRAVPK